MKALLNVGGGSKVIPIPPYYTGWQHHLLDIDPTSGADILMDARQLPTLPAGGYDAVYCSHNLEHYHRPDGARVLDGFRHVLKEDGFAEIRVPDLQSLMQHVVQRGMDLDDVLYKEAAGPVLVRDVFYGWHVQIERMGNDFFVHKTGFSPASLKAFVSARGFPWSAVGSHRHFEITGYFFKQPPSAEQLEMLGLTKLFNPGP